MHHRRRRDGASAALAVFVGLTVAALLHVPGTPPVYDGLQPPPEPYRWVSPPSNLASSNLPPLSAEATLPIENGQVAGGNVQTGDNQVVIDLGPGTFKAPGGATSVRCSIQPDHNPPVARAGVQIRGNVYRIGCEEEPGGGPVTVVSFYHLTLRFPPGPIKEIQVNAGSGWRPLRTLTAPGGDPYASVNAPGFGEYAATAPAGSPSSSLVAAGGVLVLVIVLGVAGVAIAFRRRRKTT